VDEGDCKNREIKQNRWYGIGKLGKEGKINVCAKKIGEAGKGVRVIVNFDQFFGPHLNGLRRQRSQMQQK